MIARTIPPKISALCPLFVFLLSVSQSVAQEGREIAREAFPSVVSVIADSPRTHSRSLGSGFFVQEDLIVTNHHVIKGFPLIRIKLVGETKTYVAQVVTTNPARDLAVLRVLGVRANPLPLARSNEAAVGDEVYAIGNPEGLEATLSTGIVSGIRQVGKNRFFQVTAPLSHGSSGGPILNKSGEVIGVAAASLSTGQNLNFAIPVSNVAALLNQNANREPDLEQYFVPKSRTTPAKLSDYQREQINKLFSATRKTPNSAEAHLKLAETYRHYFALYDYVSFEQVLNEYKRAIQLRPDFAKAYFGLAETYIASIMKLEIKNRASRSSFLESAISEYKQAIRFDPDYAEAHDGLCNAYSWADRHNEAIAACLVAIRLKPSHSFYIQLGHVYDLAKNYDEAIKAFQQAWALNPNYWGSYYFAGEVYEKTGRCKQAITLYQKAIEVDVNNSIGIGPSIGPYYALLRCYAEPLTDGSDSVRINEGLTYFKALIDRVGDKPFESKEDGTNSTMAHYALGVLYVYTNDTKSALDQYKILKAQGEGRPAKFAEELFTQIYK